MPVWVFLSVRSFSYKIKKREKIMNTVKDIVCGMDVSIDSEYNTKYEEKVYYFCSDHCLKKFEQDPKEYIDQKDDKKAGGCCGHTQK